MMTGGVSTSCPNTLFFYRPMVRPKWLHTRENLFIRHCSSCSVCEMTALSSAKSMSPMMVTFVFVLSLGLLKSLPFDLVCMYTPIAEEGRRGCQRGLQ